jgi:phospholipid/cholesterol/gamma-HCH transport system ATP-binding protein
MLLRDLQKSLGLAVMMVTHDLDSLVALADRIAVLVDGRLKLGTLDQMLQETDPWIKEYFSGPRGRAARPNLVMGDGD